MDRDGTGISGDGGVAGGGGGVSGGVGVDMTRLTGSFISFGKCK